MIKKIIISGLLVGSLSGCEGMNTAGMFDAASSLFQAATINDAEIQALAVQSQVQLDQQNTVASADNSYTKRLNNITRNLRSYNGKPLDYKVYLNPEVNAFALPNGSIRVYSGLMDKMTDPELLFVIGHEIGHVMNGHSKSQARTNLLTLAARKAGVASGNSLIASLSGNEIGTLAHNLVNAQYSQTHELESDTYGLKILQENNYDKSHAVSALRKLGGGGGGFFSSHPDSAKRADRIESM
ncbi:M48 family metallopeptidase [Advenella sp. RU8]|uniref:M48 family metallopeptidase n=1 Tax=Advenella sp. RU8 TaxID=3399575 RepID=UPI003AAA6071